MGYVITQSDPEASACEERTLWFCCFPIGPEGDTISSANHKANLKQSTIQNFILSFSNGAALRSLCNAYRNILALIRNNFYDFQQDPVWVIRVVSVHKTSLFPLAYGKQIYSPVWKGHLFLLVLYHWAFTRVSLVGLSFFFVVRWDRRNRNICIFLRC